MSAFLFVLSRLKLRKRKPVKYRRGESRAIQDVLRISAETPGNRSTEGVCFALQHPIRKEKQWHLTWGSSNQRAEDSTAQSATAHLVTAQAHPPQAPTPSTSVCFLTELQPLSLESGICGVRMARSQFPGNPNMKHKAAALAHPQGACGLRNASVHAMPCH